MRACYLQVKVSATSITLMSRVQGAVIGDLQADWLQCLQPFTDFIAQRHYGNVFLKGLTLTR